MSVLLPDPAPRPITVPVISVDDHLIEPADLFVGRVPAALAERAPRVIENDAGVQYWHFEGRTYPNIGLNAVVGRARETWSMDPSRFDEMRPGCFDIHARIADMDINGTWASLCFPSLVAGFCGAVFARAEDPGARPGLHAGLERLAPGRLGRDLSRTDHPAPTALVGRHRPGHDEIRRNAERGFKAVSFPEFPSALGFPSIFSGQWDPFFAACQETDTVVCLHTGASSWAPLPSPAPPFELLPTLFPVNALIAAAEWLWAGVPLRFPGLNVAMSEGGIGWVPMLIDRVDYVLSHSASGTESSAWPSELLPSEVLRRNFWFCTIDDPSVIDVRHRIGIDHIMLESDYPHADSTWPDTQAVLQKTLGHLPADELRKIAGGNAAALFRHPLPATDDWRS